MTFRARLPPLPDAVGAGVMSDAGTAVDREDWRVARGMVVDIKYRKAEQQMVQLKSFLFVSRYLVYFVQSSF